MNDRQFHQYYQETFSQIHGSRELRWEEFERMNRRTGWKRLTMLAAAVALAAALSGLAVAANFFGLRDVLLPEQGRVNVVDENGVAVPGEYERKDFVSLSGWSDTPESKALAEWQTFLDSYDRDGAIIGSIGNNPTGFEERYGNYLVYTQEMADKLEEIVARYDLKLHSWMEVVLPETWPTAVGDFLRENVTPYSGYIYENGTFRFDGDAELGSGELKGYGTIEYQFSRSVKGTFDDVALNIGDLSDFEEWGYKTADGTSVTLGLGAQNRSLILADLGDSFILVNVLTGREGDDTFSSGSIGREELEELAESFRYSTLTPAREPDLDAILDANARYMAELESQPPEVTPEASKDSLYTRTGIQTDVAREFVLLLAERMKDGDRQAVADMFAYPVQIETINGTDTANTPEELLSHYDETIGEGVRTLIADMTWDPEPLTPEIFSDGSGLASAANGAVWFGQVEEGVIRVFTLQTDQWSIRATGGREITQDVGKPYESLSLDEGRAFLLNLADLIDAGNREEIADLLAYPAKVTAPGGEWIVNTPEEFREHYAETVGGNGRGTLAADLRADPEPVLDGSGNQASAGDGAVWFDRGEDGKIRILTLQSNVWQWSVQYWSEKD